MEPHGLIVALDVATAPAAEALAGRLAVPVAKVTATGEEIMPAKAFDLAALLNVLVRKRVFCPSEVPEENRGLRMRAANARQQGGRAVSAGGGEE